MTFISVANLLNSVLVSCATLIVILILIQVFNTKSKSKFLRYVVFSAFGLLSAGVVFAKYYASNAPTHLASIAKTDPAAAVHGYTVAIRLDPDNSELYFRRAMNHFRAQQYVEALNDLNAALER